MNASALALLGYVVWLLVLLTALIAQRVVVTARTGKPANSYLPDGSDVSPFAQRLCGAHANCIESAPFIVAPLLLALATGHTDVTDPLACVVLAARIAQASVHLWSTSEAAVKLRAVFFIMQAAIAFYWTVALSLRFV
ncbi:MAG: MAPEG family protein [Chromatiales bacterium]|jgi:uncharacterized MAPEG superfamily protein|nr:MAPEG family protein [Chromatiales bacterium]MDX9766969.1 MAPEG family protein [Ectothiorhodospiraceae bacterium]